MTTLYLFFYTWQYVVGRMRMWTRTPFGEWKFHPGMDLQCRLKVRVVGNANEVVEQVSKQYDLQMYPPYSNQFWEQIAYTHIIEE